jgi:hypothetical protein
MDGAQWSKWFFDGLATFGDLTIIDDSHAQFQRWLITVKIEGQSVSIRADEGITGAESNGGRAWEYDLSDDPSLAASDVAEDLP